MLPGDNPNDYLVSAVDVRTVVEQLWLAGAEGVAVNGERITTGTAILDIGGTVLVNSAYLAPPYQISAIGPSDLSRPAERLGRLPRRSSRPGPRRSGSRSTSPSRAGVDLPAYAGTITLRYAQPDPSASAAGSAPARPSTSP